MKLPDDEVFVSFDVESLFPSVPVKTALNTLKYHVYRQDITKEKKDIIVRSAEHCMSNKQNQFSYRGKFYKQKYGTAIGNPLSPIVSNFFMVHLENKIKNQKWFPRLWLRYVDDILAIIKRADLEKIMEELNDLFETIKFTYELEQNGKIPFLDVLITRVMHGFKYSVYRKITSTQQHISADSNHSRSHKAAAFNSMFHRLFTIPMEKEDFKTELYYIMQTGEVNGYDRKSMEKLFKKHKKKQETRDLTTLTPVQEENKKFITLPFHPPMTHKLSNEFNKFGFNVAYNNQGKLSEILGTTKDKVENNLEKSGIYLINCAKCDAKYIGQTKRMVKTRYKEHCDDCRKPASEEKPMAKHAINTGHTFQGVELLKEVRQRNQLDAYESMFLHKYRNENLKNTQTYGNCKSSLFQFV